MSITNIIRIPNIEQYTLEMIHGELILTPKILEENAMEVTEKELLSYPLHDSTVVQCTIKSGDILISNKTKYRSILTDIWSSMPTQRILQTTTFNMRLENQRGLHGYNGCPQLHMAIQNKDADGSIKEILHAVQVNGYSIHITIRLESGKSIIFRRYN